MDSLRAKIKDSLKLSLKNKDEVATSTIRLILAAVKDHDIQNRTKKDSSEITDEESLGFVEEGEEEVFSKFRNFGRFYFYEAIL